MLYYTRWDVLKRNSNINQIRLASRLARTLPMELQTNKDIS